MDDHPHDARESLALWLRAGRIRRGLSLEDVAKVTKIQPRILEQLESGKLDGLPAEVFVRGFVRSVARCLGLDEREALKLYAQCCTAGAPRASTHGDAVEVAPAARALVEAMADLVPSSAARATPRKMLTVEVIDLAAGSMPALNVRVGREPAETPANGNAVAQRSEPVEPIGVATPEPVAPEAAPAIEPGATVLASEPAGDVADDDADPGEITEPGAPRVSSTIPALRGEAAVSSTSPALRGEAAVSSTSLALAVSEDLAPTPASSKKKKGKRAKARQKAKQTQGTPASASPVVTQTVAAPRTRFPQGSSVPWRKPAYAAQAAASLPSLVIDDADPDSAERLMEAREDAPRRSFLPPILLDREDRSARQGGLTLAVIILLIAATLTLSYLMRRPSASGDGMTRAPSSLDAAFVS